MNLGIIYTGMALVWFSFVMLCAVRGYRKGKRPGIGTFTVTAAIAMAAIWPIPLFMSIVATIKAIKSLRKP